MSGGGGLGGGGKEKNEWYPNIASYPYLSPLHESYRPSVWKSPSSSHVLSFLIDCSNIQFLIGTFKFAELYFL